MTADDRMRIIEQIAALLEELRLPEAGGIRSSLGDAKRFQSRGDLACHLWRLRRLRDEAFGLTLFNDPAWDMLIDLFRAEKTHSRVTISSLCAVTGKPLTTSLRVLAALEDAGLIIRTPDTRDRRRVIVDVTKSARVGMDKLRDAAFVETSVS